MLVVALPAWKTAAVAAARRHPADYVEIAQWIKVAEETGFEDEDPLALVNLVHAVFAFETANLCALAHGHAGCLTLTHIFITGSAEAIRGKKARANAVAAAMHIQPMTIR
jgi:hypothetical protein